MIKDCSSKDDGAHGRAGWKLNVFCEAAGLSRSYIYMLPREKQPRSVKVGKRRVIIEAPADWLQRVGETR